MTHDYLIFASILVDIAITIAGFVKVAINYEHRFTKLETEMMLILKMLGEKANDAR